MLIFVGILLPAYFYDWYLGFEMSQAVSEVVPSPSIQNPQSEIQNRSSLWLLLGLTLLAGLIRFSFIGSPPIWGDEAATYSRVCGTYQELVHILQDDAFTPLHYELYWWMNQHVRLTPFWMRFVPAVAGTLMVPAMYFLARQMVGKKTSLLAAAITTCSGYMIVYSRDAKMYMHFWFFCTVNVACLLWWLRTRNSIGYFSWIASGCAMTGFHATGMVMLAVEPIFVLSNRRAHWKSTLLFVLGATVILAGPVGFYTHFSNGATKAVDRDDWGELGIGWVKRFNDGRTGPDLVRYTATDYLYSWEWPRIIPKVPLQFRDPMDSEQRDIPPWVEKTGKSIAVILLVILVIGLFRWPQNLTVRNDDAIEPWWMSAFWLTAWIVPVAYGYYCASMPNPESPLQWLENLHGLISPAILYVVVAGLAALFFMERSTRQVRIRKSAVLVTIGLIVCAICGALSLVIHQKNNDSIWVPRYMGVIWPAVTIVVAILLLRLPTKTFRWTAISFLLLINLVQGGRRVFVGNEPPVDRMAKDVFDMQLQGSRTRAYLPRNLPYGLGPSMGGIYNWPGTYYMVMLTGESVGAEEFRRMNLARKYSIPQQQDPKDIAKDLRRFPQISRVVVWKNLLDDTSDTSEQLLALLGSQWMMTDEEYFQARDHWTGRLNDLVRRRVYVRRD